MDKLGRRRVITERDGDVPYLIRYYVFLKDRKNFPNTPEGRFWRGPGHFRYRRASDLHYLELERDEHGNEIPCWSLFFMGQKATEWGFIKDGEWIHNEQYLARGAKDDG
jgi:hypothetical protein